MSIILTCNAGSTNTKLAAYDTKTLERKAHTITHNNAETTEWICSIGALGLQAVGHRVVHGGRDFIEPTRIDSSTLAKLKTYTTLAPLHQPAAIRLIEELLCYYPTIPQIACFDTAFHHTMPDLERRLPLPVWYHNEGIQRYGFHGLSYQHIAEVLPQYAGSTAQGRIIVAHLGGGSSACAMQNRQSVGSTMGFSTMDGMMMGTRCGALDPGVVLHLLTEMDMKPEEVHRLLYLQSGLQGVSAISSNMQHLLESDAPQAHEAVTLYCYCAAKQIAGLLPVLGGLDALVFTGGIGENAAPVRDKIITALRWINDFPVYVIPTDEENIIAKSCIPFTPI